MAGSGCRMPDPGPARHRLPALDRRLSSCRHRYTFDHTIYSGDDRHGILASCEFGEDAAQKAYKAAIEESRDFPDEVKHMISNQQTLLKMSHDLIRNQRDQYKEAVR